MTSLRLERVAGYVVEAALAQVASALLVRRADGIFAAVGPGDADPLIRALAFAGIAAVPYAIDLAPPAGARAAIGRDLAPAAGLGLALDVVDVRRLPLGAATRDALARRWSTLRPPSKAQRERCRALLRGDDTAFAWRRRVWGTRAALRGAATRIALRPIVFDVDALNDPHDERHVLASEARISGWLS
ncbi:MAG: hypothetical protein KGN00_12040 [Chloroflexota bacterium]|nr:hypothetical protein [Chloroflexota bacterium]MDE3194406.1 hypothetical protein [Chloroflexota bacterium]